MDKLQKYLRNPALLYPLATSRGMTRWVPDKIHLSIMYRVRIGRWPDLNNPRTFNEKLQWLKLRDHNPLYNTLVDKYAVKQWVANRIGPEHVTETYARWDRAEDIDISKLPERFVLKTNHDCGGVREWPYKDVKPCVFAEEYLEPDASESLPTRDEIDLTDYKFMCFEGEPRCAFTCVGRAKGDLRVDFFDADWRHMPFTRHYPNADASPAAPRRLREMQRLARMLSDGIPFVRVDFYEQADRIILGEMTLYPGSGFEEFDKEEWDERLGDWIVLPQERQNAPRENIGGR